MQEFIRNNLLGVVKAEDLMLTDIKDFGLNDFQVEDVEE